MVSQTNRQDATILGKIKQGYLVWMNIVPHIPKGARYTIGNRIEDKFLDLLELSYITYFTDQSKKLEKIVDCILILDTLKFLITTCWEARFISDKQLKSIAVRLEEIGKMFGGWKKSIETKSTVHHSNKSK